jgi:hypothetical protein
MIMVGRKYLPDAESSRQPIWAFVKEVSEDGKDMLPHLQASEYETKTRGTSHVPEDRVFAEVRLSWPAIYTLLSSCTGPVRYRSAEGQGAIRHAHFPLLRAGSAFRSGGSPARLQRRKPGVHRDLGQEPEDRQSASSWLERACEVPRRM